MTDFSDIDVHLPKKRILSNDMKDLAENKAYKNYRTKDSW